MSSVDGPSRASRASRRDALRAGGACATSGLRDARGAHRAGPCAACRVAPLLLVGSAVLLVAALGGCQKPLFPENQPRTQFEAYEIMRQRYVPLEEPDVFGTPRPAIRARLTPER